MQPIDGRGGSSGNRGSTEQRQVRGATGGYSFLYFRSTETLARIINCKQ
jgi:hypothetical protein